MRLSRTGWNNVIIFSVMGFILLINATNQRLFPSKQLATESEVELLTETQLILSMNISMNDSNVLTIERIGQTWRSNDVNLHGQALDEMMRTWQTATGELVLNTPNVSDSQAIHVSLMIAGRMTAFSIDLFPTEESLFIYNHAQAQWLNLPAQMGDQLLPDDIFTYLDKIE